MKNNAKNMMKMALAIVALFALVIPSLAQTAPAGDVQSTPRSQVVRLNKAPISNDVLRVHLPKPVKATLSNGVRVLILEDHRFPLVTVSLDINGAGSFFDPAQTPGLASVTAQMLRQGTATRTSKQLAEDIDALGANINVMATPTSTEAVVRASGLKDNFDKWFAIATDILLHPSFPAGELKIIQRRQAVMIRQQRANPGFLGQERLAKVLYGDHPASVVSGTPESIASITPEMATKYYQERYTPQNTILAVAGDVNAKEVVAKLEAALASWKKTDLNVELPANPAAQSSTNILLVDRPGSVQTNLLLGNLAVDRRSDDYIALALLNNIVGGGAAGRLFMNLREDKGYTYGAYSRLDAGQFIGPWVANSEVRSDVTGGAMTEFFNEIRRICTEPVPEEELNRNKRAIVARFALSLERPESLVNYAVNTERYGFPDNYWDEYPAKVMAVTPAEVARVAQKYLKPEAIQVVAVGDASKIQTVLEKYGKVQVFAAEQGAPAAAK
jgi:zinc protease